MDPLKLKNVLCQFLFILFLFWKDEPAPSTGREVHHILLQPDKVLLRRFTNLEKVNRIWYLLGFLLFLIIVDENLCKTNKTYQESIFFVWHLSIPLHWSPASSSLCHLPLLRLLKIAGLSCSWGFQCFELFVNWVEYFICLPGLPLYFLQLIEHWVVLDVPIEALPAE